MLLIHFNLISSISFIFLIFYFMFANCARTALNLSRTLAAAGEGPTRLPAPKRTFGVLVVILMLPLRLT